MKPHSLFEIWRPDEVAECLDGVGNTSVYTALWQLVPFYSKRDPELERECPPDPGTNCLADFWDKLDPEHKKILNELAERQEKDFDERYPHAS